MVTLRRSQGEAGFVGWTLHLGVGKRGMGHIPPRLPSSKLWSHRLDQLYRRECWPHPIQFLDNYPQRCGQDDDNHLQSQQQPQPQRDTVRV